MVVDSLRTGGTRRRTLAGASVLLTSLAVPAAAQTLVGSEFRVDNAPSGGQYQPAVAANASGAFVVTWWTQTGIPQGVLAQRYSAAGSPLGGEFMVNESGFSYAPAVAMKTSGDFVVTWIGSPPQIYARRFGVSGAPLTGQFRVDTADFGNNSKYPRVAYDTSGGFAGAWEQYPEPFAPYQRFSAAGSPTGLPIFVADFAKFPDIAALPNGAFVVAWYQTSPAAQVWAERFDSTGNSLGGAFRVDSSGLSAEARPPVSADPSRSFVVACGTLY